MRVTYIKLENVAGIQVGSGRKVLEINFDNAINKIVGIIGHNGVGKSVLISSISPFAGVTSVDDRSSLSYIIPGKNGYKEIRYIDGSDEYVIKHYYKANGNTHSVKSYFMKNNEELNENGNVTSFLALVEIHFGLTQEMMRLIRLGTNVNSFITLTPARRKEYIGKLIDEIDTYLKIYKDINDDLRVVKSLISSNNNNLYNCHISDPVVEEDKLAKLVKEIKGYEKERDKLVGKIGKLNSLMQENNIDDLRRKKSEAEASLSDLSKLSDKISQMSLKDITVDQLIKRRSELSSKQIDVQSKINSYRISIDGALKNIERLDTAIKRVTSNNDLQSLISAIETLKESIQHTPDIVKNFHYLGTPSSDLDYMFHKMTSFNQISQMIYSLGNKPIAIYLKLRDEHKSVDAFVKEQLKRNMSSMNEDTLKSLLSKIFDNEDIISPNCSSEFLQCPYYRLSDSIMEIKDQLSQETYDAETLRYIQIISNNVDTILNEVEIMKPYCVPDIVKSIMSEKSLLDRLRIKMPFFDLTTLQEYISILKDYELYKENQTRLSQYEHQLVTYKNSGIDTQTAAINELQESISFYKKNIETLEKEIREIKDSLSLVDEQIAIVTKYNEASRYRKNIESTLESVSKLLVPLETASQEKMELEFSLRQVTNAINAARENHKSVETNLKEYNRYIEEGKELSIKFNDLQIILDAVSTKKGIPVIYMKQYLGKIQSLANNLLKLIYGDTLQLGKFKVTQDTFEVPYIKDGTKISDVKYASQSEVALITMALSFALSHQLSGRYNILLLDEIDAGLDETNRSAFLKMLNMQMIALKAEQVFIISHNLSQMVNVPMDCILLSDTGMKSKLQNVIYE